MLILEKMGNADWTGDFDTHQSNIGYALFFKKNLLVATVGGNLQLPCMAEWL
jgi:hypothetical protein